MLSRGLGWSDKQSTVYIAACASGFLTILDSVTLANRQDTDDIRSSYDNIINGMKHRDEPYFLSYIINIEDPEYIELLKVMKFNIKDCNMILSTCMELVKLKPSYLDQNPHFINQYSKFRRDIGLLENSYDQLVYIDKFSKDLL